MARHNTATLQEAGPAQRTEGDTWDLASGVGTTATLVAAARAAASNKPAPLINDPYAAALVRAVGIDFLTRLSNGEISPTDHTTPFNLNKLIDSVAVRTRFFDNFFRAATANGVRQAVILASGLDSRTHRLAWPADMVVYEVDQPEVISFKTTALADMGPISACQRRTVAIDLRTDWPSALLAAGFDPSIPTAWIAEGLLPYLPADAQDRLLDNITRLSAPGSQLAMDYAPPTDAAERERNRLGLKAAAKLWRAQGLDLDFSELIFIGDRNDAGSYLGQRNWRVSRTAINELLTANGLDPFGDEDSMSRLCYVKATLVRPVLWREDEILSIARALMARDRPSSESWRRPLRRND